MQKIQLLTAIALLTSPTFASTITAKAVPTLLRRQNSSPSCSGFSSIESSCSLQTSNFLSLDFVDQASCLCSKSSTYDGSVYDGYFQTCLSYYATASPSFYSTDLSGTDLPTEPCALVAAATGSAAASSGQATTTFDANAAACTAWDQLQEECSQETSGFGDLAFTSEASCLCYTGTTWAPQKYDGYWASCLSFYKTQSPALYSTWQSENGTNPTPCAAAGNVRGGPTVTAGMSSGNSTSSKASSKVTSTGTSSSSARPGSTSGTPTVLTTAGSATASGSASAGSTYKTVSAGWLLTLAGVAVLTTVL